MCTKLHAMKDDAKAFNTIASSSVDISSADLSDDGVLTAIRSARDIDTGKRRRYIYQMHLSSEVPITALPPAEMNEKILARIPSRSGKNIAIFRREDDSGKKMHLEIWSSDGENLRSIVLPETLHGKIVNDAATFGGPSWNLDETALVYLAERKVPESSTYFDSPFFEENLSQASPDDSDDSSEKGRGGAFTLGIGKSEMWGEKYQSQSPLFDMFVVDTGTGRVGKVQNVPGKAHAEKTTLGGYTLAQPVFDPTGEVLVFTAYDAGGGPDMQRRLGLIYCQQRPCKLYATPIKNLLKNLSSSVEDGGDWDQTDSQWCCLTPKFRIARCPRFSPHRQGVSALAFLSSKQGFDTHSGCMELSSMRWANGEAVLQSIKTVVPQVNNPMESAESFGLVSGMKFPGLFLNQLSSRPFLSSSHILATTNWGSTTKIVRICLESGDIRLLKIGTDYFRDISSQSVLCVSESSGVIIHSSSPNECPRIWHIPASFLLDSDMVISQTSPRQISSLSRPIAASVFSAIPPYPNLDFDVSIDVLDDLPKVGCASDNGFIQSILLLPRARTCEIHAPPPLITIPHGGPHSASLAAYVPSLAFLCSHGGYALLLVNFRGSTGFGQDVVDSLTGKVATMDVEDVVAATRKIQHSGLVDPNRIGICGGSHGGFLAAHCTGQYPDLFQAAALRNPVINLLSMATGTDIPDWIHAEGLGKPYSASFKDRDIADLWAKSPIRHASRVKSPTLVALGMKDLRVPPSQGYEWYHSLRARGLPTKLLQYEDDDHAIAGPKAEADHWINIKRWFDLHLKNTTRS